jgi:putative ABC transport system permease protein
MSVLAPWITAALRLLPRSFRDRFGADLAGTIETLASDARAAGGRWRQAAYLGHELLGLLRLAVQSRRSTSAHRVSRGAVMYATVRDDVRWSVRQALRHPVFALTVVLTLAVSIAAATTAFGLARAVLWRPLPFADASRLVFVWEEVERDGVRQPSRVTGARFAAWRETPATFSSIAQFGATGFTIEGSAGASSIRGVRVSARYFDTLGVHPLIGRSFQSPDEIPGRHQVVILSHAFWQEHFGGRRDVPGETLRLNGQPFTVIGVMPPLVYPAWPVNPAVVTLDPESRQLWVPIARTPDLDQSGRAHVFGVVARLAAGVSEEQARDALNGSAGPAAIDRHLARVTPLREQFVRDARTPLIALAGAALAVLLIACANLAALYVSAFERRRGELALRAAIGAGVPRLIRQLAFEALLLAGGGAMLAIVMARFTLATLPGMLPPSIPFLTAPALDLRVAGLAVALAGIASVMLTAWPIARLIMSAPTPRGIAARPRGLVYRVLVVSQIAVTVALVVVAGLLAQSLQSVRRQEPGFAVENVFVADIGFPSSPLASARSVAVLEENLLTALAGVPTVRGVAAAYDHPLEANWTDTYTLAGDANAADQPAQGELRIVSPGYFEALDVELLNGRFLNERDNLDAPGAAVVNEAFARQVGGRVLGRRVRSGTPRFLWRDAVPTEFDIVGIVRNERSRGLELPAQPAIYMSTRQFPQQGFSVIARTSGDPLSIVGDVRSAVRATDTAITVSRPTSLEAILAEQLVARRVTTDAIGGFAAAALALAALGLYGLLAVLVASRTREIGVRLALGASPRLVAGQVVRDSLRSAAGGIVIGCGLALMTGRLIQSLLVGVSAADPLTLAAVVATVLAVAAIAALAPAKRAARIDPVDALRAE